MITSHTPETLRAFTQSIVEIVDQCKGPVHLSGGNEVELLKIFEDVGPNDWICSSYRSHYHCLLRGVPEGELRAEILAGRSINLQFPAYKILTSAIVAGQVPIALGIAFEIKRQSRDERVWCFMGDMATHTGLAHESVVYACRQDLPVTFVVESNGLSVCTPTEEAWGNEKFKGQWKQINYAYTLEWPHAGALKRTNF